MWLVVVALGALGVDGLAFRLPRISHHNPGASDEPDAPTGIREHLAANDFEDLHEELKSYGSCTQLVRSLAPIVGDEQLVSRVVGHTHAEEAAPTLISGAPVKYSNGAEVERFEFGTCLELMAGERWLEAHDVCGGYLERVGACDHEWKSACVILSRICEAELCGGDYGDLQVVLEGLEGLEAYPCGCARDMGLLEPFVDLGRSFVAGFDKPGAAYGHALAAAAAVPDLAKVAASSARRAEALLGESVVVDDEGGPMVEEAPRRTLPVEEIVEEADGPPPSLKALDDLVGLKALKELCQGLVDAVSLDKERGDDLSEREFSAVFRGNPGTGKTISARLYASLLAEVGATPENKVLEVTGGGLLDDGVDGIDKLMKKFKDPQTSQLSVGDAVEIKRGGAWGHEGSVVYVDPKTGNYDVRGLNKDGSEFVEIKAPRHQLRDKRQDGGTLLVDEAYQLDPAGSPVGRRVLQKLVAEMDAFPGTLAVVLIGYDKDLDDMLGTSPGLRSRFRRDVAFPDFSDDELVEITKRRFVERFPRYSLRDAKHLRIAARRLGKGRGTSGFGNARAAAQLLERASEKQSARVVAARKAGDAPDVFLFEREDLLGNRTLDHSQSEPLVALRQMEGLWSVKASVDQLLELHASNVEREDRELPIQTIALNRVFLGNPGTGKTTVAALYGKILADLGLLSVGDVVLATPADFVGSALGQSEEKTGALLDRAKGCVLVIDEAYGLDPNSGHSGLSGAGGDPYKTSVIDAIVSRVGGDAGADLCVLLLGYEKEMSEFLRRGNPGLARRFQLENAFRFDDYDDQALLKILLANVRARGRTISFNDAKAAVRLRLAKQRLRPNFGNAGAVGNLVSEAVARSETRLKNLPPDERAWNTELILDDLYVPPAHVADKSLVLEGLVGCEFIKERLVEYEKVVEAARLAGRDAMDDLGMTFCFQGSPGTGKTTVARRFGMLFEALGVLPSSEVVQVSASDLVTGFVGQAAKKTRDVFESARGAVLFVDEAYRLYDPTGRSYMQEAVDEIVTLLTEETIKGKMVVIFAGYDGQMDELLDRVNPGLKSRVSDVISFPDFDAADAADIARSMLAKKRLDVPDQVLLEATLADLVDAPGWANGRDVETFARRVAVECATREVTTATAEALEAAKDFVLAMKVRAADLPTAAPPPPSPFLTADAAPTGPPVVDVVTDFVTDLDDVDGGPPGAGDDGDLDGALEEALASLGYDGSTDEGRASLAALLQACADGGAVPSDVLAYVVASRGVDERAAATALKTQARTVAGALQAQVTFDITLRTKKKEDDETDGETDGLSEADILQRLRDLGPCPAGFSWHREGAGWRCGGGSHFVHDDDPLLG